MEEWLGLNEDGIEWIGVDGQEWIIPPLETFILLATFQALNNQYWFNDKLNQYIFCALNNKYYFEAGYDEGYHFQAKNNLYYFISDLAKYYIRAKNNSYFFRSFNLNKIFIDILYSFVDLSAELAFVDLSPELAFFDLSAEKSPSFTSLYNKYYFIANNYADVEVLQALPNKYYFNGGKRYAF